MKLRLWSYLLLATVAASLLTLFWLMVTGNASEKGDVPQPFTYIVQVTQGASRESALVGATTHRVVVAPPVEVPAPPTPAAERYRVRNEFPADYNKLLPLYLIDTVSGQEIRLGDDGGAAMYEQARNERYLLWWFGCDPNCSTWRTGLHAYVFATGEDRFIAPDGGGTRPKLYGDWVVYPTFYNGLKPAKLTLANLTSQETITFTTEVLDRLGNSEYLAIGEGLVAWVANFRIEGNAVIAPERLEIYDLAARTPITSIAIDQSLAPTMTEHSFFSLAANESVVTWGRNYGYDVVTGSFFTYTLTTRPWTAWGGEVVYISPVTEHDRVLSWYLQIKGGPKYYLEAPLIDATPSTEPCIDGQNLVQNGDLESTTDHELWQQSGSTTNLIVNDPPPGLATGGQWAIRLGRFNNAQQAIQQTLTIPSGVKGLTLTFAVRVHSWDLWGGDRLQLDLVDPRSGQSLLATPVQWTNTQLASGDWIPMQVAIQNWPGIDTPVDLVFRTQTDWAFPTDFTIDNVQLITTCQS